MGHGSENRGEAGSTNDDLSSMSTMEAVTESRGGALVSHPRGAGYKLYHTVGGEEGDEPLLPPPGVAATGGWVIFSVGAAAAPLRTD